MRILHILDHSIPLHSGYTFRTAAILREQRRLGWETFHLTSPKHAASVADADGTTEEEVDGLHFYRTPGPAGGVPVLREWALMRALARRLEEVAQQVRPDVLHAHSPALNAIPALRVARRLGLPVVYEVRAFWEDAAVDHGTSRAGGARYRATRALETRALHRVDAVTTICEGLRRDIIGRGVAPERVTVIPNAVDADRFVRDLPADPALRAALGLDGTRVLGFVGSFYTYEGLALLIEALPEIRRTAPDVRLLLVGGGPQEARLKARAQALGLGDAVVFAGRVPHAEVGRYYGLIDLLVYPRLPMRLTNLVTPLKPLEAMAQGRLLIASDVGGHRELIEDGRTGWFFPSGDAGALAATVLRVLSAQERWEAVRAAGRRYVEDERNWRVSVARYRGLYERLVQPEVVSAG